MRPAGAADYILITVSQSVAAQNNQTQNTRTQNTQTQKSQVPKYPRLK